MCSHTPREAGILLLSLLWAAILPLWLSCVGRCLALTLDCFEGSVYLFFILNCLMAVFVLWSTWCTFSFLVVKSQHYRRCFILHINGVEFKFWSCENANRHVSVGGLDWTKFCYKCCCNTNTQFQDFSFHPQHNRHHICTLDFHMMVRAADISLRWMLSLGVLHETHRVHNLFSVTSHSRVSHY